MEQQNRKPEQAGISSRGADALNDVDCRSAALTSVGRQGIAQAAASSRIGWRLKLPTIHRQPVLHTQLERSMAP